MITEQDKTNLADLIEREPPSNILQTMLSLAGRESTRIGAVNAQMTSETPLPVQRQVATALIAAEKRVAVLRVAVQERSDPLRLPLGIARQNSADFYVAGLRRNAQKWG